MDRSAGYDLMTSSSELPAKKAVLERGGVPIMDGKPPIKTSGATWFVSRHPGTIAWAKKKPLAIDRWVAHLNPCDVRAGDTVIGTLPVNLAAKVCERGARYLHLSLDVPAEWRGREMTVDELMSIKAELKTFYIHEEK